MNIYIFTMHNTWSFLERVWRHVIHGVSVLVCSLRVTDYWAFMKRIIYTYMYICLIYDDNK